VPERSGPNGLARRASAANATNESGREAETQVGSAGLMEGRERRSLRSPSGRLTAERRKSDTADSLRMERRLNSILNFGVSLRSVVLVAAKCSQRVHLADAFLDSVLARNLLNFFSTRVGFFVSHSQTTRIRHLERRRARWLSRSRCTLRLNLSVQNSMRVEGVDAPRQPTCLCQKQPCTKITERYLGSKRSGLPGKSRR
jgi:hypothetical protein